MTTKKNTTTATFKNIHEIKVRTVLVADRGWSMVLPTFYRVVARTESSIWTKEIKGIEVPDNEHGMNGYKVTDMDDTSWMIDRRSCPRYSIKGKTYAAVDGHYAKIWDGTPQFYDYMD